MGKIKLLGAAALLAVGWTAAGHAGPVSYQVLDGATVIGSGSSATGNVTIAGSDSKFTISGNGSGDPFLNSPNFSNSTFSIQNTGPNSGTITIKVTDTNLSAFTGSATNTFTLNGLNGGGFTTGTITNYFDATNTAFGTGTMLASATCSGLSNCAPGGTTTSATMPGPFSETTIYTLTFSGSGPGTVSASSQIQGKVPEPMSLSILGVGLAAVGLLRRRRG